MFGLGYLISPVSVEEFKEKYLCKKAVVIKGGDNKFSDLFSWDDLNNIVNERLDGNENIKIVYDKQQLPPAEFENMDKWMRQGATLVVDGVEKLDPVLGKFANILAHDVNTTTWINCYVSWPNKQGFDNHTDLHDVYVVQTEGSKKWRVFEQTGFNFPIEQQREMAKGNPPDDSKMYLECTLNKGDVLYIPRGHWHYAISETPSIHLTVATHPRTAIDFLQWYMPTLIKEELFRKDFPIMNAPELGGTGKVEGLESHLDQIQQRLHELVCGEHLRGKLIEYIMVSNPIKKQLIFPIESTLLDELDEDIRFTPVEGQKFLVNYDKNTEAALILSRGKILELSHIPYPVLKMVFLDQDIISGRRILELDSGIDWEEIKKLLQQLYAAGAISIVS